MGWDWQALRSDFLFAGYTDALYWSLTPREILQHLSAAARRDRRDMDMLMAAAWYGAAFERSKRMPPLKDVLSPPDRPQRQSAAETLAAMQEIFARRRRAKC